MCGIYGFSNYKYNQTEGFLNSLCNSLARESEVRGNDATGIAYINKGTIEIYKKPKPASKINFKLPKHTSIVMGHTRHATQGSEKDNYNNHPFIGKLKNNSFAFAHNGVIYNDQQLRRELKLPNTKIETDSYIGVQLLETQKNLSLESHRYMAEQIQGSFTFTTIDKYKNLYITKGNSPVSIINFKEIGLLVYASTENILWNAIINTGLFEYIKKSLVSGNSIHVEFIDLQEGEIIKISSNGIISKCKFQINEFEPDFDWYDIHSPFNRRSYSHIKFEQAESKGFLELDEDYYDNIIQAAAGMGISQEDIISLIEMGFDDAEIEELIYYPEMLNEYLA